MRVRSMYLSQRSAILLTSVMVIVLYVVVYVDPFRDVFSMAAPLALASLWPTWAVLSSKRLAIRIAVPVCAYAILALAPAASAHEMKNLSWKFDQFIEVLVMLILDGIVVAIALAVAKRLGYRLCREDHTTVTSAPINHRDKVQFSLRALFIATAVVGAILAVGALLRRVDAASEDSFGSSLLIAIVALQSAAAIVALLAVWLVFGYRPLWLRIVFIGFVSGCMALWIAWVLDDWTLWTAMHHDVLPLSAGALLASLLLPFRLAGYYIAIATPNPESGSSGGQSKPRPT